MRRIDLNLLYILRELLKEPNTTKVGDKLGLTQSAVSASLGRLRWAFQDDLFVRSGRAMAPTKRAEDLLEPIEEIIQKIENLVEEVHFEPENLQRNFALSSSDFLLQRVSGPIIAQMQPIAPNARIIFSPFTSDTRDRIRSGHLDLMIAPFFGAWNELDQANYQPLYSERLVAAVWSKSTKYGDSLTESDVLNASHVTFNAVMGGWKSTAQSFIEGSELQLKSIAECSTMNAVVHALRYADVMAIVPSKVVEVFGKDAQIKALPLPFDVPEFEVGMVWNRSFESDPEHTWFREMVAKALKDI